MLKRTLKKLNLDIEDELAALYQVDFSQYDLILVDNPGLYEIYEYFKLNSDKFKVPVICSYSLGSNVEERAMDLRPCLIDLPNELENLADTITFLYRPEYYGICENESGQKTTNQMELIVAKNNFGNCGTTVIPYKRGIGVLPKIQN